MANPDWLWTLAGFILTLLVFSYLLGDNPLFRLVVYLFVGVTAGYLVVVLIDQVLMPRLFSPLSQDLLGQPLLLIPLLLGVMLLTRISPRLGGVGAVPLGYLVGTGAAVMVAGVVTGTLLGQFNATVNVFDFTPARNPFVQLFEGLVLLLGTICTLAYFQFSAPARNNPTTRRVAVIEGMAKIGQFFVAITLGALFAGVFITALTALIDRLDFLIASLIKLL